MRLQVHLVQNTTNRRTTDISHNPLGDRLTRMARLDEGEFNFDNSPAQGGPEMLDGVEAESLPNLVSSLESLALQIDDREQQLTVLENLLMNRNLQDQVVPAGRPITKGWLSSYFGVRTDPFTGKRARHYGLDFAGTLGGEVVAVGAGRRGAHVALAAPEGVGRGGGGLRAGRQPGAEAGAAGWCGADADREAHLRSGGRVPDPRPLLRAAVQSRRTEAGSAARS